MRQTLTLTAFPLLILLTACQHGAESAKAVPSPAAPPAVSANPGADMLPGTYKVDPDHTTILFRVSHIGMSNFTAQFRRFDAQLTLDPKAPEMSSVTAEIDVASIDTKVSSVAGFDQTMAGPGWLDAPAHPKMTFRSTRVLRTGPDTADVTGDFTLKGVTRPVTLKAKFNGGYLPNSFDPAGARIGFSATGTLKRSEFGISYGIPAPGSKMGVSDAVEVIIEAEFTQLPAKK
jgi:polyisoprenoid-binding protein YceI